jgi:toxin HigB-1
VIQSFKHKGLQNFFEKGDFSKIHPDHRKKLRLILTMLHAANQINDMNFPGSNFHKLSGKLPSFYSVNVSGNWRIIFRFEDCDAYDVDYLDYH